MLFSEDKFSPMIVAKFQISSVFDQVMLSPQLMTHLAAFYHQHYLNHH